MIIALERARPVGSSRQAQKEARGHEEKRTGELIRREKIDTAKACRLYDRLGTWSAVASVMRRRDGTNFQPQSIVRAVRFKDRFGEASPAMSQKERFRMTRTPSNHDARRQADRRRASAEPWRKWYSTPQWKALRRQQLTKTPVCERCGDENVLKPATVCHHRTRHRGNAELFFNPNNLGSLCADCHDTDEQRIESGGQARSRPGPDGWPT